MKTYTHKSGTYIAKEWHLHSRRVRVGSYTVIDLITNQTIDVRKDLIENSNDWTPVVQIPIEEYFSKDKIEEAISTADKYTHYNTEGIKNLSVTVILNNFKSHFFNSLKNVQ
jgi:hypothetical protein